MQSTPGIVERAEQDPGGRAGGGGYPVRPGAQGRHQLHQEAPHLPLYFLPLQVIKSPSKPFYSAAGRHEQGPVPTTCHTAGIGTLPRP